MRIISTRIHGYLDYLSGFALILPWILGYRGMPALILSLSGLVIIVYSIMTNYEMGAIKAISMPVHLIIDFMSGAFLIAAPWLFHLSDTVRTPFLIIGVFEMLVALLTKLKPPGRLNEVAAQQERERKGAYTR